MSKEEKELLIKDLCGRLSYGVLVRTSVSTKPLTCEILSNIIDGKNNFIILPYLRPMSSMTEEEYKEWRYLYLPLPHDNEATETQRRIDWLNSHHFDYRGLIPMGLALEALEGMYNTKIK